MLRFFRSKKRQEGAKPKMWTFIALIVIIVTAIVINIVNRIKSAAEDFPKDSNTSQNVFDPAQNYITQLQLLQESLQEQQQEDTKPLKQETPIIRQANLYSAQSSGQSGKAVVQEEDVGTIYQITTEIPPAIQGYYYEVWLIRPEPFQAISIGQMQKKEDMFAVDFLSSIDYKDYTDIAVTLEPDDQNPLMAETIVLSGKFK